MIKANSFLCLFCCPGSRRFVLEVIASPFPSELNWYSGNKQGRLVHAFFGYLINQSIIKSYARGRITSPTLRCHAHGFLRASLHAAPFPSWAPPCRIHRLAQATNSMGVPWASTQDGQDQLVSGVPGARVAGRWRWRTMRVIYVHSISRSGRRLDAAMPAISRDSVCMSDYLSISVLTTSRSTFLP